MYVLKIIQLFKWLGVSVHQLWLKSYNKDSFIKNVLLTDKQCITCTTIYIFIFKPFTNAIHTGFLRMTSGYNSETLKCVKRKIHQIRGAAPQDITALQPELIQFLVYIRKTSWGTLYLITQRTRRPFKHEALRTVHMYTFTKHVRSKSVHMSFTPMLKGLPCTWHFILLLMFIYKSELYF